MSLGRALDLSRSWMATARLGLGFRATDAGSQPEQILELCEFEACPFRGKFCEAMLDRAGRLA